MNISKLKTNIFENLKYYLASLTVIISFSEVLAENSIIFKFLSYFLYVCWALYLINFKKIPTISFQLLIISLSFFFLSASLINFSIDIFLKYTLILISIFFASLNKKKLEKKFFRFSILYPYIFLLIVGVFQILILNFAPSFAHKQLSWHGRPIGLSVEPTFFSQQILMLAVLSENFELTNQLSKRKKLALNFFLFILIVLSRTRTSILGGIIFFALSNRKISFKKLYLFLLSFLSTFAFVPYLRNSFEILSAKLLSLNSINSFGTRSILFEDMIFQINNSSIFGNGFFSYLKQTNIDNIALMGGSLYANLPLSFVFTLGIGSIPLFIFISLLLIDAFKRCKKMPLFLIVIFSILMPFMYTSFGFTSLFLASYTKKYSYKSN